MLPAAAQQVVRLQGFRQVLQVRFQGVPLPLVVRQLFPVSLVIQLPLQDLAVVDHLRKQVRLL